MLVVIPRILIIKSVSCSNQYGKCGDELQESLENIGGKSLKDTKEIIEEMVSKNLFVKEYSYRYVIPDKIAIYLIIKKAKYILQNSNNNFFALVDEDGMVLGYGENSTLPGVVFSGDTIAIGESISEKQHFSLDLISSMYYYYQVKKGIMTEDGLEVRMPDGITVIFPLEGDRDVLLGGLRVVLSKIERISTIDLRFKNPVLK